MRYAEIMIAAAAVGLALSLTGQAAEEKTKRIYMIGNSLTDNVRYDAFKRL